MNQCTRLSHEKLVEILRKVTIFSGFSDRELDYICASCTVAEAKKGEVVIEEGTSASEILVLLEGKVSIVLGKQKNPFEVVEFGSGNCIGEASVIGIQPHSASAIVKEDAVFLVLLRQVLMKMFEDNKSLFALLVLNIARELARRLHNTNEILLHYASLTSENNADAPSILKAIRDSMHLR